MRYIHFLSILIISLVLVFLPSCARPPLISFNGASLSPDMKTITIRNFYSDVAAGPANLAIQFTEKIKEFYQRNTRLALVNDNGDLLLEGTIVKYTVEPVAPVAGSGDFQQVAGQQRLTITVKVQYTNSKDDTKDFDQDFTQFTDFGANVNLSQVEAGLINEIFNRIVLDIFNKSAGDW
jgi:hypothetical protein